MNFALFLTQWSSSLIVNDINKLTFTMCHCEPFGICHSEPSEESQCTAQGKLREAISRDCHACVP